MYYLTRGLVSGGGVLKFVHCWKQICIWDMLVISSCWWVDDCWVAWYQYVLPNQIWKWWFRNVCLYEHTNSIYVCMMYMYLKSDSYSTHTSQILFPEKLQITSKNNRRRSLETPKGLHCPISNPWNHIQASKFRTRNSSTPWGRIQKGGGVK